MSTARPIKARQQSAAISRLMGITGVVNVKYAGSADTASGDVQLYHAEGFDKAQGKVEKITIAVLGGSVAEIKTGHTDPDKFK